MAGRSLRSRLILASVLWTAGLLMLMHMASVLLLHVFPRFRGKDAGIVFLISFGLMAAGVAVVRRSLVPFRLLRGQLAAVRRGAVRRVPGTFPSEVRPLVEDLNSLLENREQAVKRAQASAGDLAHGLKTPLALLAQEAGRAADGNPELAANILQQVERMSRQVDYHLARARAAASGSGAAVCQIAPHAAAVIRTLEKLHSGRRLSISADIETEAAARIEPEDLEEILGNLLDNACKWTHSHVILRAAPNGGTVQLTVDDDGPGLPAGQRAAVLERGVRLDEAAPGSGLGLAIVRDLAELYGGGVTLEDSPQGGLRARVWLPVQD